jgi:hypothetical protein
VKPQIKVEFVASVKEKKRLAGILAIPRISLNGNLYLPEELARVHGRTVPVLWNHEGSPRSKGDAISQSDIIGTMHLSWDPDLLQLRYEAEVDCDLPAGVPLHTSLGAFFEKEDHVCGSTRCYSVPRGLNFVEASLRPTPGIPETTVQVLESFQCKQCKPPVSSLCGKASSKSAMSADDNTYITGKQFETGIKALVDALGVSQQPPQKQEAAMPSSMVDDASGRARESYDRVVEFFRRVKDNPKDAGFPAVSWNIDKNEYLARWGYKGKGSNLKETVAVTAGDMGQVFSKQVVVVPGGRMRTPVRQYCAYEDVPAGNDRAHFYTIGAFDFAAITEGTELTNVAQTVAKKTATPAVRGAVQRVGYSQIESAPFVLLDAINQAMALAAVDDEAADLLSSTYDAMVPTNWVRADTGEAITSDDVAGMTFKREGLLAAKRLIAQQGHDVSPGNLVLFMHPKAYQELMLDTNLGNFYQYARPDVTETGVLEQLYGVDIVIADQVKAQDNTTNDTYRNVLAVKGVAFGLASAREVAMEAQRRNELQQLIISGTHRIKSVVIDETASCRISSAQ